MSARCGRRLSGSRARRRGKRRRTPATCRWPTERAWVEARCRAKAWSGERPARGFVCESAGAGAEERRHTAIAVKPPKTADARSSARAARAADADDVALVAIEREVDGGQLFDFAWREREDLAEVRVPDDREVAEVFVDRETVARLLGREDVLELLDAHGRAVTEIDADIGELFAVRQPAQPRHVLGRQQRRVRVERVARSLVVVRVVHAAGDRGVVVAEDGDAREALDDVDALVGRAAVTDRVAEAIEDVDALALVRLEHRGQRLVVGVNVAEDSEAHRRGAHRLPVTGQARHGNLIAHATRLRRSRSCPRPRPRKWAGMRSGPLARGAPLRAIPRPAAATAESRSA